jgi:hypothetical protein
MPLIETQSNLAPLARIKGGTALSVIFTEDESLRVRLAGKTNLAVKFTTREQLAVLLAGTTLLSAQIYNLGEPNLFLSVNLAGSTEMQADLTARENLLARLDGKTDLRVSFTTREAAHSSLQFIVDVLPEPSASKTLQQKARLTIDGQTIPYRTFNYQEPRRAVGANLTVQLARLADRNLITRNSIIKFELGKKVSGVWEWTTKFDSGELTGKDYSIGWATNAPTDTLSISAAADLNKKLSRTPPTDLIIYDPAKLTLNNEDFEPLLDTEGRTFAAQLVPTANLKLYTLFQKTFVERCGFASVKTNLPDYPVERADFGTGSGYYEGIKPLVGMFEPVVCARGNELWILETSQLLPAGFPAPRSIRPSGYRGLNLSESHQKIDALLVTYSESATDWDYVTPRTIAPPPVPNGTFGTNDYTETTTVKTVREYRKFSAPAVVVKTDVADETRSITDSQQRTIHVERSQFFYDGFGRQTRVQKTIESLVPNFALPDFPLQLLKVREENALTIYAAHPFEPRRQYQKSYVRQIRGLIAVDSENQYLDEDFRQDFTDAHRAGNLVEGITTEYGAIKTITATQTPRRDGTVESVTNRIDHLRSLAYDPQTEVLAGDVSLNGQSAKQSRVLVFAEDNAARSTDRIEPFAVGPLPSEFFTPLARRRLKKRQNKPKDVSFDLIGWDETIERGSIVTAIGRLEENLGAFLIEGLGVTGEESGAIFTTLQGQQI